MSVVSPCTLLDISPNLTVAPAEFVYSMISLSSVSDSCARLKELLPLLAMIYSTFLV